MLSLTFIGLPWHRARITYARVVLMFQDASDARQLERRCALLVMVYRHIIFDKYIEYEVGNGRCVFVTVYNVLTPRRICL